jgi:hypothetical protein
MVLANLGTLFLFNTEDSLHKHTAQINVNVENGETFTHHGVHKNIQLHQQIVRQHLDQKRAEEKNKKWTAVREARKNFKKGSKLAPMDDGDDDTEEFDYTEEEVLTDAQPQVKSDVKKDKDQALKEALPLVKSEVKTEETPASKEAHLKVKSEEGDYTIETHLKVQSEEGDYKIEDGRVSQILRHQGK